MRILRHPAMPIRRNKRALRCSVIPQLPTPGSNAPERPCSRPERTSPAERSVIVTTFATRATGFDILGTGPEQPQGGPARRPCCNVIAKAGTFTSAALMNLFVPIKQIRWIYPTGETLPAEGVDWQPGEKSGFALSRSPVASTLQVHGLKQSTRSSFLARSRFPGNNIPCQHRLTR